MAGKITDVGVRLTADTQTLKRDLNMGGNVWTQYASHVQQQAQRTTRMYGAMGGAWRQSMGVGRSLMGYGAQLLGGFGFIQAVKQTKDFEQSLVALTMNAEKNRKWMDRTRSTILSVSDAYGHSKEEVMGFVQEVVAQTGDAELATKALKDMGQVAYASFANMQDLGKIGIQMSAKLGLGAENWKAAFGVLAKQAQMGSVELKDMAAYLPSILTYADQFGHKGMNALKQYGALFQVARRGNDSAAESATSMMRMFDMLISKRSKIEKVLGVPLKEGGKWRDLSEILEIIAHRFAIMEKTGRDFRGRRVDAQKLMLDIFQVRGQKTMAQLVAQARAGWGTKIGSYETYESMAKAQGGGTIEALAKKRPELSSIDMWNKAVARLSNELHRHMLPVVEKLATYMPELGKWGKWAMDNFKYLLSVWLSIKAAGWLRGMLAMMTAMRGAGAAGGVAGAAGAAGAAGRGGTAIRVLGALSIAGPLLVASIPLLEKFFEKEDEWWQNVKRKMIEKNPALAEMYGVKVPTGRQLGGAGAALAGAGATLYGQAMHAYMQTPEYRATEMQKGLEQWYKTRVGQTTLRDLRGLEPSLAGRGRTITGIDLQQAAGGTSLRHLRALYQRLERIQGSYQHLMPWMQQQGILPAGATKVDMAPLTEALLDMKKAVVDAIEKAKRGEKVEAVVKFDPVMMAGIKALHRTLGGWGIED